MNNTEKILQLLESIFGTGKKQARGEYLFFCPSCHHHKPKLIVKIDSSFDKFQYWHCWICQSSNGTRGRSLNGLLKRYNATNQQLREMRSLVGDTKYINLKKDEIKLLFLPREYKPLWIEDDTSLGKRHAMVYLRRRGITDIDIMRYQIGYAVDGSYANRIIIPSFDSEGILNYFTARSYFKDAYLKYKNPEISKDVVVFELFLNWQLPITLVEGVFDAIAVRRNAIPLLGKTLLEAVYEKIVRLRPPAVYIALDKDAIRDALVIAEKLNNEQIPTYVIQLEGKDPSELGFEKMIEAYDSSPLINESVLFDLIIKHKFMEQ